ncbi:hypothetical protein B0H15DRAFT_952581 [Mycena belliarum]|uniref:Uncharacterized protein n=1 Tax=Mycena belliarum TaxID=1033014 RepID=A0AAD6TYL0_9AGAR|nr:hypothetical protein B0H15DRAFT_952581 [Mycena belliae]
MQVPPNGTCALRVSCEVRAAFRAATRTVSSPKLAPQVPARGPSTRQTGAVCSPVVDPARNRRVGRVLATSPPPANSAPATSHSGGAPIDAGAHGACLVRLASDAQTCAKSLGVSRLRRRDARAPRTRSGRPRKSHWTHRIAAARPRAKSATRHGGMPTEVHGTRDPAVNARAGLVLSRKVGAGIPFGDGAHVIVERRKEPQRSALIPSPRERRMRPRPPM